MGDAAPDAAAAADAQHTVREYVLRMAPPEERQQHRFLGSFPLGPPGFRERRKGTWALSEQEPPGPSARGLSSSRRQQRPKDWSLEELTSGTAFQGTVEAGMSSGSGAPATGAAAADSSSAGGGSRAAGCYFLLTRRGNDFVAQPVHEWLTFRPTNARRGSRTLEEAEAAMANRAAGNGVKAMPRLAELAAAGPADEEAMAGGDQGRDSDGDAEGADSDVEGALGRLTTKGSPAAAAASESKGGGKDAAQKPVAGRRPAAGRQRNEKGEDWEYEDDRADDDLEMGRDEDADMPAPRRQGDESEEEGPQLSGSSDGDAPKPLSSSGAQLQKLLRKTGLDDGSDAELSSDEATPTPGGTPAPGFADDDMDDEDDEEFLQNMARQEAARQVPVRQPPIAPKAGGGAVKPAAPAQRGKRKGQTDIGDQASTKKAKGSGVATGPAQGALAAAGASPSPDAAAAGPPTQSEIVEWLRTAGPVAMSELTRRFKKRLTSDTQRKIFGATIKAVAVHKEITAGAGKVIMLKPVWLRIF